MKRQTIFLLAVLAASVMMALPDGSMPSHDARFLNVEITYKLNADGSWEREYSHLVRLDTYYAFNRALGETFIVYNPDFQKLEVIKSDTTMADGRKVASPANAFNEVLPFAAHGFADFAGLREMVVTHVGLERGARIDLRYRIHCKPGFLPVFSGREALARDFPVDKYRLEIKVPAGQTLRYRVFGSQAEAQVDDSGAGKIYTFELASLPPAAHEALAPAGSEPAVVFSTAADWPRALANDPAPLPAALVERIEKLKAQYPARTDLLAALQKAVAVEVKNCGLGPEALGWKPRPLSRVFQGNHGTRLEKALLLRALLKKAGFGAELLAVASGVHFAPDVPTPLQFGEFWLKVLEVPAEGVAEGPCALYLDPWSEQHEFFPYRLQERDAWNLERQALEKLPASDWEESGVDVSGLLQLDPTGVTGDLVVAARGSFHRYGEAAADSGKFIAALLKKFFPVEKAEVKKLLALSRHEVRVEVAVSGKWLKEVPSSGAFKDGSKFYLAESFRMPGLSENMIMLDKRESPMALEAPFRISLQLELQPAAGLKLEYAAPVLERRNDLGYYSRGLVAGKNGLLRFSTVAGIRRALISPESHPLLRELLLPYFAPDYGIVFKMEK